MEATTAQEPAPPTTDAGPTYPKRDLPEFTSNYPHGLVSGEPRSAAAQKALDARKAMILRTMTETQIEEAYQETVAKIKARLEEDKKKNDEIDRGLVVMEQQRELERKIFTKYKLERDAKKNKKVGSDAEVKEERIEPDAMEITQP
jgi:hypothetical protein